MQTPLVNTAVLYFREQHYLRASCIISGNAEKLLLGSWNDSFSYNFYWITVWRYINAPFTISDSVLDQLFILITGLHGTHVIIGTIFISMSF